HFDVLDRATAVTVDGALGLNQMVEQFVYAEDTSVQQPALRNLRGRVALQRDAAGTLAFQQLDMDGRPLRVERRFRQDYTTEADWTNPAASVLDPTVYRTVTFFDSHGRIRLQTLPDGTTRQIEYLQ